MDEALQDILNTNEGGIVAVQNGGNAAQQFHPEAELKLDLQQKQTHEMRGAISSVKFGTEQLRLPYPEFSKLGKQLYTLATINFSRKTSSYTIKYKILKVILEYISRVRPFLSGQISSSSTVAGMEERTITIATHQMWKRWNQIVYFQQRK